MDGLAKMIEEAARALMAEYADKLPEGAEYIHGDASSSARVSAYWRTPMGVRGYITREYGEVRAARWESATDLSVPVPL
jgi:hypothetical protein